MNASPGTQRRLHVGLLLLLLLMFSFGCKARHAALNAACQGNLKQVGFALHLYANDHGGAFPPLSSEPGTLMFAPGAIQPRDFGPDHPFACPIRRAEPYEGASSDPATVYDDESYYYLGYVLRNDDDVEAFAKAYRQRIAEGGTFQKDLIAEIGGETRTLERLNLYARLLDEGVDPSKVAPPKIPVLIELAPVHTRGYGDKSPIGAHVFFLHSQVPEFVEWGTWPLTEKTQRILAELAERPSP